MRTMMIFKKGDKVLCVRDYNPENCVTKGITYECIRVDEHHFYLNDNTPGSGWQINGWEEYFILDCPLSRAIYLDEDV